MIIRWLLFRKQYLWLRFCLLSFIVIVSFIFIKNWYTIQNDENLLLKLEIKETNGLFESMIKKYEDQVIPGLGENGSPAYLPEDLEEAGEAALKKYAMNYVLSDRISLKRKLGYFTHPLCKKQQYNVSSSATVIIIFYNEFLSVILRTVWSVLIVTPKQYLDQIILVDDGSDRDELKGLLDYYIQTRFKDEPVKLVRMQKRSGLIRARLFGARLARSSAQALVFLDAHCEVTQQWLEPLLARIEYNRTIVPIPIIDLISEKNFEYSSSANYNFQVGGFTWDGTFDWIDIQQKDLDSRKSPIDPVRTPTMAGGLFAIERNYFWESGSYDEQMDGWGGENLEMSFRIWQCGGTLEIVPCSRVGHIFRDFHPYKFPNNKDTHGVNTARVAKVWMDEYAKLFFLHRTSLKNDAIIGDITHRKILREKLRCRSFKWYLENIYPEKFIINENVRAYGRVSNAATELCLDNLQSDNEIFPLGVYSCYKELTATQFFSLSNDGELRQETKCAEIVERGKKKNKRLVEMTKCHNQGGTQLWKFTKSGNLINPSTKLCLNVKDLTDTQHIYASKCTGIAEQVWHFDNSSTFHIS